MYDNEQNKIIDFFNMQHKITSQTCGLAFRPTNEQYAAVLLEYGDNDFDLLAGYEVRRPIDAIKKMQFNNNGYNCEYVFNSMLLAQIIEMVDDRFILQKNLNLSDPFSAATLVTGEFVEDEWAFWGMNNPDN